MVKQGRPRKTWSEGDAEQFKKLCAIFCTRAECAAILGMDVRTLDANIAETFPDTPTWGEAFEHFSSAGRATLRRRMFELAVDGDKAALIFMAKNYLGMSDGGLAEKPGQREKPDGRVTVTTMVGNSPLAARRKAANG